NDTLSSLLDTFARGMETNDMKSFNTYLQANYDKIKPYVNAIKYTYNMDFHIYKDNDTQFTQSLSPSNSSLYNLIINYSLVYLQQQTNTQIEKLNTGELKITKKADSDLTFFYTYSPYSLVISNIKDDLTNPEKGYSILNEEAIVEVITILFRMDISAYKSMDVGLFNEMIDNEKFIKSQYKILNGSWNNNQVYIDNTTGKPCVDTVLVLNDNNELDDYLLYSLGFIDDSEMDNLFNSMMEDKPYSIKIDYNRVVGSEFKLYLKSDTYYNNGTKYVQTDTKTPSDEFKDNYIIMRISGIVKINEETKGGALDEGLVYPKALTDYCINKYNTSAPVIAENLAAIDKGSPKSISIYANSFELKKVIEDFIGEYNAQVGEDQKITYTDYMGLMMSMVGSIVDTVSYVLIAFVSVSLVVSSIMIGIITYISVLERTKEIGVLRSVGASKRDIKRVFTAESLIIGFTAGTIGILITLLLCIPINLIMKAFTGIATIASLPVVGGIILILISMLLTFIAGLIPAKLASKKDPVIALRSE
ncbi:MAG: ABC transporter permease, partial [Clostridia bacterium]